MQCVLQGPHDYRLIETGNFILHQNPVRLNQVPLKAEQEIKPKPIAKVISLLPQASLSIHSMTNTG